MPRTGGSKSAFVRTDVRVGAREKKTIKLNAIDVCSQAKNDASPRSVQEQGIEGRVSGKSRIDSDMTHGG